MRVAAASSLLIGSLAFATAAAAQPARPAPPAKVPMLSVPCLPERAIELLAAGEEPVLCWADGCMAPSMSSLAATIEPRPAPTPAGIGPQAELRPDGPGLAACKGSACTRLGARLTKAIAEARAATDGPPTIGVTGDLQAVALGAGAWSVAKDKPIAFKTPKSYQREGSGAGLLGITVAGNLLVTQWSNCAGPCTRAQVTDASGKHLGADFAGGGPITQIDADRFAIMSEYGDLHIVSRKGKAIDHVEHSGDPSSAVGVVRLAPGAIAILHDDSSTGLRVEMLDATGPHPIVTGARALPYCTP